MKQDVRNGIVLLILGAVALIFVLSACSSDTEPVDSLDPPEEERLYFPAPQRFAEWETTEPADHGWNATAEPELDSYLESKGTKAFLILKSGRMAKETYFGSFTRDSVWYWASAGKTLTAFCTGLALQEDLLQLEDATAAYLGGGWTSAPVEKEPLIQIRHQLSMSSGLDDTAFDCVVAGCLQYTADAGERWAYHNGPYTLLQSVIAAASGESFAAFFNSRLRDPIGMEGFWFSTNGSNNVFFSTPRSMARFGLLVLGEGSWDSTPVLDRPGYLEQMTSTSQQLNKSYGYLWWLNGKDSYRLPATQVQFPGSLIPNAPADLIAGLGKNDQKLYVVPSLDLVIVRMGEDAGENLAGPSSFDNALWEKINAYIGR